MTRLLIIAAAGEGRRLGRKEPKALVPLLGRPLISWTLEALAGVGFARTVLAVPPGREGDFARLVGGAAACIAGGDTRGASVRRAFEAAKARPTDVVCIHDAARPLVTGADALSVIDEAERFGAAIAATPIVDTVKQVEADRIVATLDRRCLFAAATPQVFRAELLDRALRAGREATDEAALLEEMEIPVAVVSVSRLSLKITTSEDLEMVAAILRSRDSGLGTRD
jgi:2-C-methyl-D-erythritol 4-phosphate cytidylyltransferase